MTTPVDVVSDGWQPSEAQRDRDALESITESMLAPERWPALVHRRDRAHRGMSERFDDAFPSRRLQGHTRAMSDDAGVFRFTISVALHGESDPNRAIEWMAQHVFVGVQSGGLPIRGTAPDGTSYLWFPERGKTPDEYLASTFPPEEAQ